MMTITNITPSGTDDILRFALTHHADIKNDTFLQSLINDETEYLLTVKDVNFMELFRLTQEYRDRVKILNVHRAEIPNQEALSKVFPGSYKPDPENKPDEEAKLSEIAQYAAESFLNLALQMSADDDIIREDTAQMFLPMISRTFDVQIPINFMDLLVGAREESDVDSIFNENYPATIYNPDKPDKIPDSISSNVMNMLYIGLMKATSIIRYDKHYDDLLKMTKYFALKNKAHDQLCDHSVLGFHKYDPVTKRIVKCSMFKPNRAVMADTMKRLAFINTPLIVDVVVRCPIHYMQIILNSYTREDLPILYESSMSSIIEDGITFNDFKTHGYDTNSEDPDEQAKIVEYNNAVSAYSTRITEANQIVLNALPIMLDDSNDVDVTSAFALLPSVYTTKAVFEIKMDDQTLGKLEHNIDDNVEDLMHQIIETASGLDRSIRKLK